MYILCLMALRTLLGCGLANYYPLVGVHSKGCSSHLVCPLVCLGTQSSLVALDLSHADFLVNALSSTKS